MDLYEIWEWKLREDYFLELPGRAEIALASIVKQLSQVLLSPLT